MTLKEFVSHVSDLCDQAGCSEKLRETHKQQALRDWHPHPPREFVNWWSTTGAQATEKATGCAWRDIDATRAYNCQRARDTYMEAKQIGAI